MAILKRPNSKFLNLFIKLFLYSSVIILFSDFSFKKKFSKNKDVKKFIKYMVKKHNYNKKDLKKYFSSTKPSQKIIDHITKPLEQLTWGEYNKKVVSEIRIREGVEFYNANISQLKSISSKYGVPPHMVVAILGIESSYGKVPMKYQVFQALSTLAFLYPPRAAFFKKELEEFLLLVKENPEVNALEVHGSYAGAIGPAQFMPSNLRYFKVKLDPKNHPQILYGLDEAMEIIPRYLTKYGWKKNIGITHKINSESVIDDELISKKIFRPHLNSEELKKLNVTLKDKNLNNDCTYCIFELTEEDEKRLWLGTENLYAITMYNNSINYAMAAYTLGKEIHLRSKNEPQ